MGARVGRLALRRRLRWMGSAAARRGMERRIGSHHQRFAPRSPNPPIRLVLHSGPRVWDNENPFEHSTSQPERNPDFQDPECDPIRAVQRVAGGARAPSRPHRARYGPQIPAVSGSGFTLAARSEERRDPGPHHRSLSPEDQGSADGTDQVRASDGRTLARDRTAAASRAASFRPTDASGAERAPARAPAGAGSTALRPRAGGADAPAPAGRDAGAAGARNP